MTQLQITCTDDHANGIDCPAHPGAAEETGPLLGMDSYTWALRNPLIARAELLAAARESIGWSEQDQDSDPTGERFALRLRSA